LLTARALARKVSLMTNAKTLPNEKEAKKFAVMTPWGLSENIYLAESLDRRTSLAVCWFRLGPRGGLRPRYAVRLGIDHQGIAMGGCCMFDIADAQKALDCFNKYAAGEAI